MEHYLSANPTAVEQYFFTPLYYPRTVIDVVWWWERRRPAFNVWVGSAGMTTLAALAVLNPDGPSALLHPQTLAGIIAYGFAANVCYTLGWFVDVMLRRSLGTRAADLAPVLLRYGFVFAMGLTLLPIPVFVALRVISAVVRLV